MVLTLPSAAPPAAQLNKAFQAEESPGVIYCISMQWFREWEAFVKGKGKDNGEWSPGLPHPPAQVFSLPQGCDLGWGGGCPILRRCPGPGLLAAAGLERSCSALPSRPVPAGAFPSCRHFSLGVLLP